MGSEGHRAACVQEAAGETEGGGGGEGEEESAALEEMDRSLGRMQSVLERLRAEHDDTRAVSEQMRQLVVTLSPPSQAPSTVPSQEPSTVPSQAPSTEPWQEPTADAERDAAYL